MMAHDDDNDEQVPLTPAEEPHYQTCLLIAGIMSAAVGLIAWGLGANGALASGISLLMWFPLYMGLGYWISH